MSALRGAVHSKWIIGKVIGTKMRETAKVRVTRLVLDPYLLKSVFPYLRNYQLYGLQISEFSPTAMLAGEFWEQFYNKRKTYFAHDPHQQCIEGDIVLLKAMPEWRNKHVKHELAEIVYKVGRVIDPVTGKPCAGQKFLESITDTDNLTDRDTSFLSEKLQELTISSPDK